MWHKPTQRWLRLALISLTVLAAGGLLPVLILPAAQASSNYDNQNPVQAGCTNGAQSVSDSDSVTVNEFHATVQVQSSSSCPYGLWVRVSATSGTNGQYKATITLTRTTSSGSVTQEQVIGSEPFLSNMLGDENSCVKVTVLIESLNGDAQSTTQDELCNQGFPATTSTTQTSATTTSASPGTTTTTTVTTASSGDGWVVRTEETVTSTAGVIVAKSVHRSKYHQKQGVKHRKQKRKKHHRRSRELTISQR